MAKLFILKAYRFSIEPFGLTFADQTFRGISVSLSLSLNLSPFPSFATVGRRPNEFRVNARFIHIRRPEQLLRRVFVKKNRVNRKCSFSRTNSLDILALQMFGLKIIFICLKQHVPYTFVRQLSVDGRYAPR